MFDAESVSVDELWELTKSGLGETRAEAMVELATRLKSSGNHDQVESLYTLALEIFTAEGDERGVTRVSYSYGHWLNERFRSEEAMPYIEAAIAGYERDLNEEFKANAIRQRAVSRFHLGHDEMAIKDLQEAIQIYVALSSWYSAAFVQVEYVRHLQSHGRFVDAMPEAQRGLEYARMSQDPECGRLAHEQMASMHNVIGELEIALDHLETRVSLAEYLEDTFEMGNGYRMLGSHLVDMRRFDEAMVWLVKAVAHFKEHPNASWLAMSEFEIVRCLYRQNRTVLAREAARKLRAFVDATSFALISANIDLLEAEYLSSIGELDKAAEIFTRVQEFAVTCDDGSLDREVRLAWAEALNKAGQHEKALATVIDIDMDSWGQHPMHLARHIAVLADAHAHVDVDMLAAMTNIQDCIALGKAQGLAVHQAQCYRTWAEIELVAGNVSHARELAGNAVGLYLRADRADLAAEMTEWLLPEGYFSRVSHVPEVSPDAYYYYPFIRSASREVDVYEDEVLTDDEILGAFGGEKPAE